MTKIQIKGIEYPCRVTMGAMLRYKRESGEDVSKLKDDNMEGLVLFLWCCVKSACNADGVDFPYNVDEFADALSPQELNLFVAGVGANNKEKKTALMK